MKYVLGFVSSALHKSLDGNKVVMYAQWRNLEEYQEMRKKPSPFLEEALNFATSEPGMFEVVAEFETSAK